MIAILENSGAFVYGCTAEQADERIKSDKFDRTVGTLDYDENGNHRKGDGMLGWLFMDDDIVFNLIKLGCEAIYVNRCHKQGKDYIKCGGLEEMGFLDTALRKIIGTERQRINEKVKRNK